jgi:hypothetical protein
MTTEPQKRAIFANPFFVVLQGTSVIFVLTVLAYLISPYVLEAAARRPPNAGALGSIAWAIWFDRNAPLVLSIELVVMLLMGTLAMATESWFSPRSKPGRPT